MFLFFLLSNFCFAFMGCQTLRKEKEDKMLANSPTEAQVVLIANTEAKKLNYSPDDFNIKIDVKNSLWQDYVSKGDLLEKNLTIKDKLKNKDFWAVYYDPKREQMGGDLWVFVDKKTGVIINILRGQ